MMRVNCEGLVASQKENVWGGGWDGDRLGKVLRRHEEGLAELQREMKGKVSRSDFMTGLSSKVSLSEITNISMDLTNHDESIKLNQSNSIIIHSLQQQLNAKTKEYSDKLEQLSSEWTDKLCTVKQQITTKQQELLKRFKASDEEMRSMQEKKGNRSQLDKIMHLTSLLAIQFELIKKRFTNFETDYNMVWKEISNIYTHQENFRTVLDTEQKNRNGVTEREKRLQMLFRNVQGGTCVNSLFGSVPESVDRDRERDRDRVEEARENGEGFEWEDQLLKMRNLMQNLQRNDEDNSYSLKLFSERLGVVQNYHQNWFKSLKQIERTKKDLSDSKTDVQNLHQDNLKLKEQCKQIISHKVHSTIKKQTQHTYEEITAKMSSIFAKCAKYQNLQQIKDSIGYIKESFNEKCVNLGTIIKKHQDQNSSKLQYHDGKIKNLVREVDARLKVEAFKEHKTQLMTTSDAVSLVKKTETELKGELHKFSQEQKEINQALCSQNIVMRWVWTSGLLKGGNLVAWDRQTVNTLPENFSYLKHEYCLKVVSGGMYRLQLGFYAKKKPTIQILINGQTIVSAVNSNSYVVHHSSGKLKDICNSEVAGLTYQDFLFLQDNTRIAIAYTGQTGHGFLGLQRV